MRTGGWSLIAKMATAANLFVGVPFVLSSLGPVQFGAWATLVSLVVLSGFLDLGIGNGAMNLVAAAHGRGNKDEVAAVLHEGWRVTVRIAFCFALVVLLVLPWVPWHRLLGLPDSLSEEGRLATGIVLAAICVAAPLSIATRVQLGLGQGARAFRWQAIGQLATLAFVVLVARKSNSLTLLTAAAVLTPLIASLANTIELSSDPALPRKSTRNQVLSRQVRKEGLLFFVLQLASALAYSADLVLISSLRGPVDAGSYSIVQRLFSIVPMCLTLVWTPLWPIYRQSLASRDSEWIIKAFRRSMIVALIFSSISALALNFFFDYVILFIFQESIAIDKFMIAGFAVWIVFEALGTSMVTLLNAASILRYQVMVSIVFSLACVAAKAWAVGEYGVAIVPWVTTVVFVVICLIPTAALVFRLVNNKFIYN